mgnify:CR=1 FL=1
MITITTSNVNGIRAAKRKGIETWAGEHAPDIWCMQEVRAPQDELDPIFGEFGFEYATAGKIADQSELTAMNEVCRVKGRAGVGLLTDLPVTARRYGLPGLDEDVDSGRWIEADVTTPQGTYAIDTGFIVYNDRTYPRFMGLLSELGISGQKTQMSFSVHNPETGLEYNGHTLTSLFAQRRNLVNPTFWRLLGEIVRFNRLAKQALDGEVDPNATLQTFLDQQALRRFLRATIFCRWGPPSGHPRCRR